MPITLVNYKGVDILYADFSDCHSEEDNCELISLQAEKLKTMDDRSAYVMTNPANTKNTKVFFELSKKLNKEVFDIKAKARAIFNIDPGKKPFLYLYNKNANVKIESFDSKEEAMRYLWGQSEKREAVASPNLT